MLNKPIISSPKSNYKPEYITERTYYKNDEKPNTQEFIAQKTEGATLVERKYDKDLDPKLYGILYRKSNNVTDIYSNGVQVRSFDWKQPQDTVDAYGNPRFEMVEKRATCIKDTDGKSYYDWENDGTIDCVEEKVKNDKPEFKTVIKTLPENERMSVDAAIEDAVDGAEIVNEETYHPSYDKDRNGTITEYSNGVKVVVFDADEKDKDGNYKTNTTLKIGDVEYADYDCDGKFELEYTEEEIKEEPKSEGKTKDTKQPKKHPFFESVSKLFSKK